MVYPIAPGIHDNFLGSSVTTCWFPQVIQRWSDISKISRLASLLQVRHRAIHSKKCIAQVFLSCMMQSQAWNLVHVQNRDMPPSSSNRVLFPSKFITRSHHCLELTPPGPRFPDRLDQNYFQRFLLCQWSIQDTQTLGRWTLFEKDLILVTQLSRTFPRTCLTARLHVIPRQVLKAVTTWGWRPHSNWLIHCFITLQRRSGRVKTW